MISSAQSCQRPSSSFSSSSEALAQVQLKIQSLILLRFNRDGLAVSLLEREYFSYFNEKLQVESFGFASVLELLQSMKEHVHVHKTQTRAWTCRDGIQTVWALELEDVTARDMLVKLFLPKSQVKIKVLNTSSGAGSGVSPHKKKPMVEEKRKSKEEEMNSTRLIPPLPIPAQNHPILPNSKISLSELAETSCGFSKEIQINRRNPRNCLGRGRFGKVWRGNWNGLEVAVKIFPNDDDKMVEAWKWETRIYESMKVHSDRCAGFLGSATVSDTRKERWIITRYFHAGSLAHFLANNTISLSSLVQLVYSLVNGLGFLHLELQNDQCRNGISHGDIKPENILVSQNMTCVFVDFGSACLNYTSSNCEKIEAIPNPGTIRYMAPEILNGRRLTTFEQYKKTDIYSTALVLWQLVRRTEIGTDKMVESYELPYFDHKAKDPGVGIMQEIVCKGNQRPKFSPHWSSNSVTKGICKMMESAWNANPMERPSSSLMNKTIVKLIIKNENKESFQGIIKGLGVCHGADNVQ